MSAGNKIGVNGHKKVKRNFYIVFFLLVVILPCVFLIIYEQFAGGVFNGFWGQYKRGVVEGSELTSMVYPLVTIGAYGLLAYYFKSYIGFLRSARMNIMGPVLMFIIATVIVAIMIFWRPLTT